MNIIKIKIIFVFCFSILPANENQVTIDDVVADDDDEPIGKKPRFEVTNENAGDKIDENVEQQVTDVPPVELILNMSEIMHKANTEGV